MGPHPILMQTLHNDRNREVQSILAQAQLSTVAAGNEGSALTSPPHPGLSLRRRVRKILGLRRGVVWARA
jgi:hypothetical protein